MSSIEQAILTDIINDVLAVLTLPAPKQAPMYCAEKRSVGDPNLSFCDEDFHVLENQRQIRKKLT